MKTWYFAALFCSLFALVLCGCESSKKQSGIVTFYGTVVNEETEQPLSGVDVNITLSDDAYKEIRMYCSGGGSVTGSDGYFEIPITVTFEEVPTIATGSGQTSVMLTAKKNHYVQYSNSYIITRETIGQRIHVSFVMSPFRNVWL